MNKRIEFGIAVVALIICASSNIIGQGTALRSSDRRISVKIVNADFEEVVTHLGYKYGILVGLEKSVQDSNNPELDFSTNALAILEKIDAGELDFEHLTQEDKDRAAKERVYSFNIDAENAKINDVAGLIAKQLPNYNFESSNGVVNFYPAKDRSTAISNLLNLTIRQFAISKDTKVRSLPGIVAAIPEVKEFLICNGLQLNGSPASGTINLLNIMYDRPIETGFILRNASLKEVLNQINRSKKGGWVLSIKNSRVIELDI